MKIQHRKILTMPVAVTSYAEVSDWATQEHSNDSGDSGKYICVANVHMCMTAFDNPEFNKIVNNADLVVPDGRPLAWGLKMLDRQESEQVRGADLMLAVCAKAERAGIAVGLYGTAPETLQDLVVALQKQFPELKIDYVCSPPFRSLANEEDEEYIREINDSGVKILFVAIGCPKQEQWMADHRGRLSCVMLGVGAAFAFISGRKTSAPRWMQKIGCEWVFRLASDPRRLWKRYLLHNPRFIWHFGKQLIGIRLLGKKSRLLFPLPSTSNKLK